MPGVKIKCLLVLVIVTYSLNVNTAVAESFSSVKKKAAKIYSDNQATFYCGCNYSLQFKPQSTTKKRLAPDWSSCGYVPRKQPKRASRVEWEHVMPAHHFGKHLQCWRDGGRKACRKDSLFRIMEVDMHNLVPAVGEINGDRSNYKFGMIQGENRVYGACDAEVDFKARRFEPAKIVRVILLVSIFTCRTNMVFV